MRYICSTFREMSSQTVLSDYICSSKLSFLFLVPVSFLFNVFQYMVEVSFSGLSCRGLSLRVYSDAPLTYISYQFFLNCSFFPSKSIKNLYSKKRLNAFVHTRRKLNHITST